ncbi:hypothetical protein ACI797_05785 [Geodermatophilus sp. SYSU D00691]
MPEWLTIEVLDAEAFPASMWQHAHGNDLVEAAVTNGALYWEWHETRWGVVLELVFPDDERLERYRALPAVQASLDAVPDRVDGLLVYRGRGGGAGASVPRRPRPKPVAGSAEWPRDDDIRFLSAERGRTDLPEDLSST